MSTPGAGDAGRPTPALALVEGAKQREAVFADAQYASMPRGEARNYFHDYFRTIPFTRLATLLHRHSIVVDDRRWLVAGCGSGDDLWYLTRRFRADWTAVDISEAAVEMTTAAYPQVHGMVADLERLPYGDRAFDVAFCASTLHHLPRPLMGLYELVRVAREAVILIEPNDSWLTRLATAVGAAQEYEPSGNYVYRFGAAEMTRVARAASLGVHVDRCFALHRVAKTEREFRLLAGANRVANALAPRLGNSIIAVLEVGPRRVP